MKEIRPFTVFQKDRIVQLEQRLLNVNNFERKIKEYKSDTLFISDVDDSDITVDKTFIKAMKGGIGGVYRELKSEGLGDIASQIIFLNRR